MQESRSLKMILQELMLRNGQRRQQGSPPTSPNPLYLPDDANCPACGQLRLGDKRVRTAVEGMGVAVAEIPTLACHCDEQAREKEARRVRLANLPHEGPGQTPLSFANFKPRAGTEQAQRAAEEYAKGEGPPLLVLAGTFGSGKSHLLEAVGRQMFTGGFSLRFEQSVDLLDKLRASFQDDAAEDFEDLMGMYRNVPVFLLDDLGAEKGTEWAVERLTAILDDRIRNGKRTMLTTNLSHRDMDRLPGYGRLASRIFDQRSGASRLVVLSATDYRLKG